MKTTDLRGAARLAAEATAGLTDLVEALHERIARLPGLPGLGGALDGRTTGITGLVYKSIRGITRVVGGTVDGLLGLLTPALSGTGPTALPSPEREAVVAALNGVLGDHLAATHNPLATPMALRSEGRALVLCSAALDSAVLEYTALSTRFPQASPTLLVMVHGLCMNDLQWQREGHDHGAMLAPLLGATPLYLHYNTGRPIAQNGLEFAGLLQRLVDQWPVPVQRVLLLTHSMGGLVSRSALHQAAAAGHTWPILVSDVVFLGTPHHGAPLERAGHGLDIVLGAAPYAAPLARLGKVRSAGITDLRHGHCIAGTAPLPLPPGPRCWTVAAVLGDGEKALTGRLLGDGLVPLASALGQHKHAERTLAFAPERQCVVQATNHLQLLSSPAVAAQLQRWLMPTALPTSHSTAPATSQPTAPATAPVTPPAPPAPAAPAKSKRQPQAVRGTP